MNHCQRKETIAEKFFELYHQQPTVWGRAPGRVDLMGSHTDYNMGFVMTMTIDRDTWIAAVPRGDGMACVYSLNVNGGGEFALNGLSHDTQFPWTNYLRGVAFMLQQKGYPLQGWNGLIHSSVPFGSGLSSSAALEMAAGVVFQNMSGITIDPVEMALLGQKAENEFVGVNCGILDQYSSMMGQAGCAVLLDCRSLTSQNVPIAPGIQIVICDTRIERNLAGTEYGERRAQCEEGVRLLRPFYPSINSLRDLSLQDFEMHEDYLPAVVAKRCRFIIEENQRVLDLAGALAQGDRRELRRLYEESYAGARDLYEIGSDAMEMMMKAMLGAPGAIAARQAGAGFGGCMVAMVEQEKVEAFAASVREQYAQVSGFDPAVYPVEASNGAGLI